ncbi:MAG: YihY family inner membrane protein [Verrucomicrobia bacterium]|nr:YihY family inner membrane protein [Verrucomicrobiota bacterium]
MSKKSFARLARIVTGAFGAAGDETFSLEAGLSRFEKFVHFWVLVVGSFRRNRCPVRASALSFTTLLALIPMLAVAMSVTTMFLKSEGQGQIESFIEKFVEQMIPTPMAETSGSPDAAESPDTNAPPAVPPGNDLVTTAVGESKPTESAGQTNAPASPIRDERVVAVQKKAAGKIHEFIQNAYSGRIGVVGVVFLLWTAIVMLTRVEETFNDIWGVTQGRNWLSRVVLYWATITLGPLLLVGALGLATGSHFQKTRAFITDVPFVEPVFSQLLPVIVITITFALFYKLMPNTRVQFGAALVGGALAGTAWHLFNVFSLYVGSRAVNASKIYGSLALVPLLMLGLYTVWVIVLFGAQVAYAYQNRESYLQEKLAENVNQRGREFVALRLMTCIGQRFNRGQPPPTVREMSRELGIPSKLVQQVLQTLLAARLVVEVSGTEGGYSPARPLEAINGHHILLAMRATQGQELVTRDEPVRLEVYGEFARIQAAEKAAASSVTMLALVNRAQARLEIASPTVPEKEINATTGVVEVTELPNEPALATVPEVTPTEDGIKPASPQLRATTGPMAEVSTDDNQTFPL